MKKSIKSKMRNLVLDILAKRRGDHVPSTLNELAKRVSECLRKEEGYKVSTPMECAVFNHSSEFPSLEEDESAVLTEIFWDLFREKVITLGFNVDNPETTRFSIHSEAPKF